MRARSIDDDAVAAVDWVRARGVAPDGHLTARRLPGGVSSSVVAIHGRRDGVVVKRALATLQVEHLWQADPDRSLTEAAALRVLGAATPGRVPRVLDADGDTRTLVLERAPLAAANWRDRLLAGDIDPTVGDTIGMALATWHRRTWMPWAGATAFERGATALEELRLRPFHETAAARLPDLAAALLGCAAELRTAHRCLVHGDLSPKNVLVAPGFLWILDPEVAHVGDPILDVAFMGAHLALTAVARPAHAAPLAATWRSFLDRYLREAPPGDVQGRAGRHVGALLLARTDGLSREPGLDEVAIERARALGRGLLCTPAIDAATIIDSMRHARD